MIIETIALLQDLGLLPMILVIIAFNFPAMFFSVYFNCKNKQNFVCAPKFNEAMADLSAEIKKLTESTNVFQKLLTEHSTSIAVQNVKIDELKNERKN